MNDKVKDLYDFLTNEGYDFMGSEDDFRGKLKDGAKAGELYSFLTNEGYDFMGTYDEFISKVGAPYNTAAANRAAGVGEESNRAQQAQQPTQRNMGTPGYVPNRFGIPTQQGMGPVADAAPHPMTTTQYVTQQGQGETYTPSARVKTPTAKRPKPMAPAPRAGQWSGAPNTRVPFAPEEVTQPNFVQRYKEGQNRAIPDGQGNVMTHKLSYAQDGGKWVVYPSVQPEDYNNPNSPLRDYEDDKWTALDRAYRHGDVLEFDTEEEAKAYTEHYKDAGREGALLNSSNGALQFMPLEQGEDTKARYDAQRNAVGGQGGQVETMRSDIDSRLQEAYQRDLDNYGSELDKGGFWARMGRSMQAAEGNNPAANAVPSQLSDDTRDYQAAKHALDNSQKMIDEANAASRNGNFFAGAGRGMRDKFFDVSTWDFGITDLTDQAAIMRALEAYDKGEQLTESQQALLDAKAVELATTAYFGSELGRGYKAGQVTAEAIPFMFEMAINPAAGVGKGASKAMVRYALKKFGKEAIEKGGKRFAAKIAMKYGTRIVGDVVGAGTMAATTGAARTAADALDRMAGNLHYDTDEQGNITFDGHTDAESWVKAFGKAFASTTIENYSEMLGNYFGPALGLLGKGAGKIGKGLSQSKVADFIRNINAGTTAQFLTELERRAQWHGVMGEYAEEVAGGILNALVVGDQTLDTDKDTGVFNLDNNIDTFLGVALMGGFFSGAKTVGYGVERAHNARQYNKANRMGASAFGDGWADVQAAIESDPKTGAVAVQNDPNATREQKVAALRYAEAVTARMGMEQGKAKRDAEGVQTMQEAAAEQSYNTGYEDANTDELRSDINMAYTDARAKLVEILEKNGFDGEDAVADIDENPTERQKELDNRQDVSDDIKYAVAEYVSAKSAWDGVQQRISDDAADRADQRRAEGERMAYKGKGDMQGMLRPLTINEDSSERDPETGERKKKTVYLVNGNIAIEPNGNGLSREGTDKTIYVYDPETGEAHELDPFGGAGVLEVGEPVSMEDYLANNEQQSQAEVQQAAETAQGKVKVNTPFITPQGRKGVVQSIEGDNAIVLFADGEMEQASMPLAEVQQYADALRRQEYEARHPQQTATEQPQQPNTATETFNVGDDVAIPVVGEDGYDHYQQYRITDIEGEDVTVQDKDGNKFIVNINNVNKINKPQQPNTTAEGQNTVGAEVAAEYLLGSGANAINSTDYLIKALSGIFSKAQSSIEAIRQKYQQQFVQEPYAEIDNFVKSDLYEQIVGEIRNAINTAYGSSTEAQTILDEILQSPKGLPNRTGQDISRRVESLNAQTETPQESGNATAEQPQVEYPRDKQGNIDYDKIGDAATFATALGEEFGEDAPATLDEIIAEETAKMEKQNAVGKARIRKRLAMLEEAKAQLTPSEEAPAETPTAEVEQPTAQTPQAGEVPDMSVDKASDARARDYRMQSGVRYDRQGATEGVVGSETEVKFTNKEKPVKGRWKVVEAGSVQPSHIGGQNNPLHFITEAQPKDRTDKVSDAESEKIAANINPKEIIDGVTAYTGAPVVNGRGEVIQGNNRATALRKMGGYAESAARYKQYLIDHAADYGLNAEDIAKMQNPVMVREVDVTDQEAIRLGQFTATDTESGGKERISADKVLGKLTDEQTASVLNIMLRGGEETDETLMQLIDRNGADVLTYLAGQGAINDTQVQSAYGRDGRMTPEAKNDLADMVTQNIFKGGADNIKKVWNEYLPVAAQKALLQAMAGDLRLPKKARLIEYVRNAIMAVGEIKNNPFTKEAKTAEDYHKGLDMDARQADMLSRPIKERYSELELYIAVDILLTKKQNAIKAIFGDYQRLFLEKGADLFEAPKEYTPEEAIEKAFGIKLYKTDNNEQGTDTGGSHETGTSETGETAGNGELGRGERQTEGQPGAAEQSGEQPAVSKLEDAEQAFFGFLEWTNWEYGTNYDWNSLMSFLKWANKKAKAKNQPLRKFVSEWIGDKYPPKDAAELTDKIFAALKEREEAKKETAQQPKEEAEGGTGTAPQPVGGVPAQGETPAEQPKSGRTRRTFKKGEKKSVEQLFDEEKAKYAGKESEGNEYAEVLAMSETVADAVSEFNRRADAALKEADDWRNRTYKPNNAIVEGQNGADEYTTTIGAANERRRENNIKRLEDRARELQGYAETLKERTGYTPAAGQYISGYKPSKKVAELEKESNRLAKQLSELEEQKDRLSEQREAKRKEIKGLRGKKREEANAEITSLGESIARLNEEIDRAEDESNSANYVYYDARDAELYAHLGKLSKEKLEALAKQLEERLGKGTDALFDNDEYSAIINELDEKSFEEQAEQPKQEPKLTDKEQATLDKFNTLTKKAGEIKAAVGQLIGEPTQENYNKATEEVKAKVDALLGEYRGLFSDLSKDDLLTLKKKVWAMLGSAQEQYRQNESKENGNLLNKWANLDTEINKALRDHYGDKNLYMGDMVVPFKGEQGENNTEQPRAAVGEGENKEPKESGKNIADVEAGGAVEDKLEKMGVEVSADIAENRRVRKQAENDKSENGKVHELRTTDGKVYGFAYRGKLYLDPRKIDAELPLHEYAHLWTEALRMLNPKKWAEVVEKIKQDKDAWQFIKSTYPDLKTDSEIADEVIATFSGKNGAEKLKAALDRFTQNNPDYKSRWNAIFNSIAKALQDFWKAVGDFLNIKYESAQQIYDQVLKDFVSGMNPRARVEKYLQERETAYMQAAERGDVAKATEILNQALSEEIGNGMTPFIAVGRYDRASRIPTLAHKVKSRDPKAIDEVAELIAPIIPKDAVLVPAPSHNGRATDMLDLAKAIAKRTGSEVADVLTSEPRDSQYETKKRGGLIASQDMGITMTGTLPEGKIPVVIDNVVGSGNTAEACVRAIGKGLVVSLGDAADRYNHAVSLKSAAPILRDRNNNIVPLSKRFELGGSQYLGRSAYERADGKAARVSAKERKLRDAVVDLLRKAGIDVVTESEEGQRVLDMANGRERQHKVYHGSGADFERFDHSHMGEGEGGQSFGWGTYVTEVEGIGKKYANDAVGKDSPYQKVEYVGEKTDTESLSNAKAIAPLFNGGSRDWNGVLEFLEQNKENPRTQRHIEWFKKTRPEDWKSANDGKRTLYTVEIPRDNGKNYIDFNAPMISEKLKKAIGDKLKELGFVKIDVGNGRTVYGRGYTRIDLDESFSSIQDNLGFVLGGGKEVSELLHSAGYVGIKYPADYYNGGRADNAKNYVIFDEGDLQITDKIKFFRTENGEAYGFTMGGKIYLDPRIATAETPIHEYTHLWAEALRAANPKAWERLKETMKSDTELWEWVKGKYPEIESEDELAEEVFAHYSGRRGAERLRAEQERMEGETQSLVGKAKVIAMFERLRDAMRRFWNMARDLFAGKSEGVERMSAEDFADMAMADLLSGFNPSTDSDVRFRSSTELFEQYPTWLSGQTTSTGQHTTQITSTVKTYQRIGDWMQSQGMEGAKVLDASSGLGAGTQALRDMGFDVEDVEPYPSENREAPTYTRYEDVNGKYDVVISNAVLNVIPDDWRADVLRSMADKVKEGGKLIINVRDAKSIESQKQKIELDSPSEILVTDSKGNIRAYQKGFTKSELKAYVESELGEGWQVEIANEGNSGVKSGTAVVVTRGEGAEVPNYRKPADMMREGGEEANAGEWYDRNSVERIGEFAGYTPKQIAKMNARQEESARKQFNDTAEKLHLSDNITFADTIDDVPGLTDKQRREWRRKKGWYSPRTGKIVIILGNHRSMDDVMKSILHEGVAHHGLRQMFGEHFNTFLDNVYQNAHESIRDEINAMAKKHGWNFREATEEYLAKLAEDTDFEKPQNQSWWGQVKQWFFDMLHKIGFKLHDAYDTITDNELRYVLWRSYQNLVNPGRYNSVVEEAKDIAKQYDLKVGQWDETWTAAEAEPNATIEYNGRKIPVWAGNGRRGNRADRVERADRVGSDYNVAADGVVEDAAEYAQRDAEYMEAVNSGDMEKAQRMVDEAAKRAMPDTKVVDENGNPLVVYHATPYKFTKFNPSYSGRNTGEAWLGKGMYFGTYKTNYYGENLMAVYLDVKKPMDISEDNWEKFFKSHLDKFTVGYKGHTYKEYLEDLKERGSKYTYQDLLNKYGLYRYLASESPLPRDVAGDLRRIAESEGYDGIIGDSFLLGKEIVVYNPSQIKSADPVTYDDNGNVIPLSQRFNEGSDDIRFRDGEDEEGDERESIEQLANNMSLGTAARFAAIAARNAQESHDNAEALAAALNFTSQNLEEIVKATKAQKKFDKATVKQVTDMARVMVSAGYLDSMGRADVKGLLKAIRESTGETDNTDNVNRIIDIMVKNQLKNQENTLATLLKIKGSRVDARGINVQGKLDPNGQQVIKSFNDNMKEQRETIESRIADAEERMTSEDKAIADAAYNEKVGLQLALDYVEKIGQSKADEKDIEAKKRAELSKVYDYTRVVDVDEQGNALFKKDGTERTHEVRHVRAEYKGKISDEKKAERERVEQTAAAMDDAIRHMRMERIDAYTDFIAQVAGNMKESMERAKAFREADKRRVETIHHLANSEMQGRKLKGQDKDTILDNLSNNVGVRIALSPLMNLDQMLRMFGRQNVDGKGNLWNYYMRGWIDAVDGEQVWKERYMDKLNAKVKELFGKHGYNWLEHYSNTKDGMTVQYWDGTKMKEVEMPQSRMLYIYAVEKMPMGKATNRRMGLTDEDIAIIEDRLDPKLKEFVDWAQSELLPEIGRECDKVHMRMFGAHMDSIENYFPFDRDTNAMPREEENGQERKNNKITVLTGAIKKRTPNVVVWDMKSCNIFDVLTRHIEEMSHWANFAELNRDFGTLESYNRFKQQVMAMDTVYGSGKNLWNNFMEVCAIATDAYDPQRGEFDKNASLVLKGVAMGKVALRPFTAIKQILSQPAFWGEANPIYMIEDLASLGLIPWYGIKDKNPENCFMWAWRNMPNFRKRVVSRTTGNFYLQDTEYDKQKLMGKIMEKTKWGMLPNIAVDAWTIAMGSHAVYRTNKDKYIRQGLGEREAEHRAIQDAELCFNKSQQSSEGAFMAPMQIDHTVAAGTAMIFRNASTSYTREWLASGRQLKRLVSGEVNAEAMAKQILRARNSAYLDGEISSEELQKVMPLAKRELRTGIVRQSVNHIMFGWVLPWFWRIGGLLPLFLLSGDDDEKKKRWEEAKKQSLFGPVEGFLFGDVQSDVINKLVGFTDKDWEYIGRQNPTLEDLGRIKKELGYDPTAAITDALGLLVGMCSGINPQTIVDWATAIVDKTGGDRALAREGALFAARLLNCPPSQLDQIYFDEIEMTGTEASNYTIDELVDRWAEYKTRNSHMGLMPEKALEKTKKRGYKIIEEKVGNMSDEALAEMYDRSGITGKARVGKVVAERLSEEHGMDLKDSFGSGNALNTKYGKIYAQHRTYIDMAEDITLNAEIERLTSEKERLESIGAYGKLYNETINKLEDLKDVKNTEIPSYKRNMVNELGNPMSEEVINTQMENIRKARRRVLYPEQAANPTDNVEE